jgi:prepilin-type N-terminal cleavage/methylation domain-containing protein
MSSKSTKSRERRGSGGFSLIEVIVALAILGIALVSLVELFSVSLRSTKKSADYTTALIYARSIMEEAYAAPSPEDMGGTFDLGEGYSGERAVREVELPWSGEEGGGNGGGGGEEPPFKLFEITVTVTWPPGGQVVLTGRRAVYEAS